MNIRTSLMAEHSKNQAVAVARYSTGSAKRFRALMDCFFSDEVRLAQRAAWSVRWAMELNTALLQPYLPALVDVLEKENVHDAVIRNALKVLDESEVPESCHGALMTACFRIVETPATAVALKAYALSILQKLAGIYPEIGQELKMIVEDNWDNYTAAFRSRGKKVLASISKQVQHKSI